MTINYLLLNGQKNDYNWITGYRFREDTIQPAFGVTRLDFNTPSLNPRISYDTFKRIDFLGTNNCISNYYGQYQFAYNGYLIEDNRNQVLKNGIFTIEEPAEIFRQISTIIPLQANRKNILLSLEYEYIITGSGSKYLYWSEIDSTTRGIEILTKKKVIIQDTIQIGYLSALRHSNGRDWWIIIFNLNSNNYYSILLNGKNGEVLDISKNYLHNNHSRANNVAIINKIGTRLAVVAIHNHIDSLKFYLDIFTVDREIGKLNLSKNFVIRDLQASYQMHGVAFSPNSKYLYLSQIDYLFQIDMERDSLVFDTVARYDGFTDYTPDDRPGSVLAHTKFGFLDLAPDGRIYGTTSCCTQRYMYVIDKPNLKGKDCNVKQHSLKITMHKDLPTFPNYRLGPIDGSIADTLGIDNIPVAEFRYDQDTLKYRKIEFTNLSWYDPDEWWWDWGDGSPVYYTTVWDTAITHEYAKDRVYNVCLRAKNKNEENTICKKLQIGTTIVNQLDTSTIDISLSPNPCNELFIVQLNNYLPERMELSLLNLEGKIIAQKRLYEESNLIDTELYPSGVYIIEVTERRKKVFSSKLFINH